LFRILLYHPAEPAHDDRVLALRQTVLSALTSIEAVDQGLDQRLLEPARGVRIGDNFWGVLGQITRCSVQPPELRNGVQ